MYKWHPREYMNAAYIPSDYPVAALKRLQLGLDQEAQMFHVHDR